MYTPQANSIYGGGSESTASCCDKTDLHSVLIATLLMSSVPLSGVCVVFSFAGDILDGIFPTKRNLAALFIPLAGVCGTIIPALCSDRVGRKPLLLSSCAGMALSMLLLGTYYHQRQTAVWWGMAEARWAWVAFAALCGFMFFNQLGLGPLASVVCTEIMPASIRGLGMGVATGIGGGVIGAASSYSALPLSTLIGYDKLFWGYGIADVLIAVFIVWCVPETAQRSLEQIQASLRHGEHGAYERAIEIGVADGAASPRGSLNSSNFTRSSSESSSNRSRRLGGSSGNNGVGDEATTWLDTPPSVERLHN